MKLSTLKGQQKVFGALKLTIKNPEEAIALFKQSKWKDGLKTLFGKAGYVASKFPKVSAWLEGVTNASKKAELQNIIQTWDDELLGRLDNDLGNVKYATSIKDLAFENPSDLKNVWQKLKEDPYHYRQLLEEGSLTDSRWLRWSQREFFKEVTRAGKTFEAQVSGMLANIEPPFGSLITNGFRHLKQIYLKSANGKFVIADDLLVKKFTDEFGEDYYRAVINDSKLTSKSPWTDNQATELIDIFKRKTPTPPTYIEFEVRTSAPELLKQGVPLGLTTGTTVRIYRSDVYKTISNGGGGFGQTIKMF
ncbi:hypothetical protein [Runella sp. SP2]|uniref:hypothetical protein n=1 Tax=Runella sp. SP2 TaxID=2268026 RepID=UPI0019800F1B|nr:hypothetical protein [Runella sp. SP2]